MNTEIKKLLASARKVARNTYSPYSKFPVGAALMTAGGKVFTGCNVENASYGLTLCAERVAVTSAVAAGYRKFKALAVVGGRRKAARPCGACLQVLSEFCGPDFPIYLAPLDKPSKVETVSLGALLPHVFRLTPES
jgi:cytidine deaminase